MKDMSMLVKALNDKLDLKKAPKRPFIYKPPSEICPFGLKGFQALEGEYKTNESKGYCQMWAMFYGECVLRNPDMDLKTIYKEAYDTIKGNSIYAKNVIRGYVSQMNDAVKDIKFYYKKLGVEGSISMDEFLKKYIEYLKKQKQFRKTKKQVFTGLGKFSKPIPYKK